MLPPVEIPIKGLRFVVIGDNAAYASGIPWPQVLWYPCLMLFPCVVKVVFQTGVNHELFALAKSLSKIISAVWLGNA